MTEHSPSFANPTPSSPQHPRLPSFRHRAPRRLRRLATVARIYDVPDDATGLLLPGRASIVSRGTGCMNATGWKGGLLGVRVGKQNRAEHFSKDWDSIEVEIEGVFVSCPLTPRFWERCPEFRERSIHEWFIKCGLAPWPKGSPPKLELTPLGGRRFRLSARPDAPAATSQLSPGRTGLTRRGK